MLYVFSVLDLFSLVCSPHHVVIERFDLVVGSVQQREVFLEMRA